MAYADHVLADAPYAYWPMQEASGSTNLDIVNGRVLTWNSVSSPDASGPPFVGKQNANQVGAGGGTYAHSLFSWAPTDYTVEWWSKPSSFSYRDPVSGQGTQHDITGNSPSYWGTFCFHGYSDDHCYAGTDVATRIAATDPSPTNVFVPGSWMYRACTYTASGTSFSLYTQGALKQTKTVTAAGSWTGLTLGCQTGAPSDAYQMQGRVAHIALHAQALSAGRIAARYREALQRGGVSY